MDKIFEKNNNSDDKKNDEIWEHLPEWARILKEVAESIS